MKKGYYCPNNLICVKVKNKLYCSCNKGWTMKNSGKHAICKRI